MKLKKISTLIITLVVCFALVACKKCSHVDANNDGVCDKCGKDYDNGQCKNHVDGDGDGYCDNCGEELNTVSYKPKWELNPTGFNGQGMKIKIKCLPVNEFDPYATDYTGTQQELKARHQSEVQQAYNVKIEYVAWADNEAWGSTRAEKVVEGFTNGSYQENDIYVVNIVSSWIPTIIKSGALAQLGSLRNGEVIEGVLADFNSTEEKYIQNKTINEVCSATNILYGINTSKPTPDHFIYYNIDLVEKYASADPADLWLKGEWNLSTFQKWVQEMSNATPDDVSVLDIGFPEFAIGLVASTGNQFVQISPVQRINFLDDAITENLKIIQNLYADGYYVKGRGTADATDEFIQAKSVLASGSFWFIKASNRWDSKKNNLRIGVVPYPASNDDNIQVLTSSDASEALIGSDGNALQYNGEYVTGLDLSNASFQIPYTSTTCFSVLDYANGKNGINATIVANILVDLYAGLGDDPSQTEEMTEEQSFRVYLESLFDRQVDVDVVMSVYDKTYYEIFEAVSMTVGGNSQFGTDAFWPLCATLCKDKTKDPYTTLNEVYNKYRNALVSMGYNPL